LKVDKNKSLNDWPFNKYNYFIFLIGLLLIFIGYLLMYTGATESFQSVKLAPVILVVGYLIVLPISIFYRK